MFIRKSILTVAAILITAVSVWGQFATTTTTTTTSTSTLPPIGIGTTETAQVILTNNATSALTEGTAPSCTGSVSFYNASGSIIGSATSFTLGAAHQFRQPAVCVHCGKHAACFGARLSFRRPLRFRIRRRVRCLTRLRRSTLHPVSRIP